MTELTTEQMVKELDAKFEGFAEAYAEFEHYECERFKLGDGVEYTTAFEADNFMLSGFFDENKDWIQDCFEFKECGFSKEFDTIAEAHDYFIVKGGEL